MSTKDSGGPAFPCGEKYQVRDLAGIVTTHSKGPLSAGMSLLDYYAAHAPIDLSDARAAYHEAAGNYSKPSGDELLHLLAEMRMAYAYKMIAARDK
jgi:hypothetical protein